MNSTDRAVLARIILHTGPNTRRNRITERVRDTLEVVYIEVSLGQLAQADAPSEAVEDLVADLTAVQDGKSFAEVGRKAAVLLAQDALS